MPIAPTLILGLGGTGSKIIMRVAQKVRESGYVQSERIAFVAFDTDINDLADIKRQNPSIYTVQTSTRSTVGEYLNINTNARDNWFPVNEMLNRKTLTEGAAQVRAISRLAFDTTLKAGNLDPLHRAVEQLFRIDKDQEEQALRVIITSSLAGGTGSGILLPVAMYLSNMLRTKYPKAKAITRGFFIQPDVFFTVIGATEEQRNLQVNAYAAVRELDAFLMKGDNTLSEDYKDLVFEFPKVAAEGVDVINSMPYDFCFLFDSNNTSGGGLDSFDSYLDHAATCIYAQSLGPMSKRSNSREDNVLREVIKNDGRNRYAGAGASRLVYPWVHMRDYIAYRWAEQALSLQWLTFDDQIKDRREAVVKQRAEGYSAKDVDTAKEFMMLVGSAADNRDPFAKSIENQCLVYDENGITKVGERWWEYVGNLKNHVLKTSSANSDPGLRSNAAASVTRLMTSKNRNNYVASYFDIKRFHDLVERHTEENAGIIAYTLFRSDSGTVTRDMHPHQLETYLREKVSNDFIHPVSARYFLYQTRDALTQEKKRIDLELDASRQFFEKFEERTFMDSNGQAVSPQIWANQKPSMRDRLRKKPGPALVQLITQYQNYVQRVEKLREQTTYSKVLEEGIRYVQGLAEAYETLFKSLDSNLKRLRANVETHRTRYDDLTGSTTRYVLANSGSLDFMYKSMPYAGGAMSVAPELSERIYGKVRQYHMLTDEKAPNYFQDLYNDQILGYFRDQVSKVYQSQIEIDVIEALQKEYRATSNNFEERKVNNYVTDEIEKAKRLAAPFLEHPLGEERHPIQACAFNPRLEGDSDPKRKALVSEHLGDYGGERDSDISPQEILFYNAIYGIRASDLSKYAPARNQETDKRPAGSYFSAYQQLVAGIKPTMSETRVITPHIDRRWHTIAHLPELDDSYQHLQMSEIHRALLNGLAYKIIVWERVYDDSRIYRYQQFGALPQEFTVSNGTPCDKFYEVLDALTISPVAVREVLETVDRRFSLFLEDEQSATFASSPLAIALREGLSLGELIDFNSALRNRRITLFDVAIFYAISAPKGYYSELTAREMTVNFLEVLRGEVFRIEESSEALPVLQGVLRDQFETFRQNVEAHQGAVGAQLFRKVRTILRPLGELLEDLRMRDLLKEVEEYETSLQER